MYLQDGIKQYPSISGSTNKTATLASDPSLGLQAYGRQVRCHRYHLLCRALDSRMQQLSHFIVGEVCLFEIEAEIIILGGIGRYLT